MPLFKITQIEEVVTVWHVEADNAAAAEEEVQQGKPYDEMFSDVSSFKVEED